MRISDVLRGKAGEVVTVEPGLPVRELIAVLGEHGIGAAVVSRGGGSVDGIVSERDVVRAIGRGGASVLSQQVASICTVEVTTVAPDRSVDELMGLMTAGRFRHVPVVADGRLIGIVSIGDLVKSRIAELEDERAALTGYISSAG